MNILSFHSWLTEALNAAGHRVINLIPEEDALNLPALLETLQRKQDFVPDLVFQHEHLGRRLLLRGLDTVPCPTAFLAVDSHLNMFWHRYYARLFDILLTPHYSLFQALPPEWRHPNPHLFPHMGSRRAWKDFSRRPHTLATCARITPFRRIRGWMAELLAPRGLLLQDGLSQGQMFALYNDTRVIPNESIAYEVNFRLFEGASCGALVLTQDCGPDQAAAFTDGKEMLVWHDGLELLELETFCRNHPDSAEAMGRAARERVLAEHLPEHRAAKLLELAAAAASCRTTERVAGRTAGRAAGNAAAALAWLTEMQLTRNGLLKISIPWLLKRAEALPDPGADLAADILAGCMRLCAESKRGAEALALARARLVAPGGSSAGSPAVLASEFLELSATASAVALIHNDPPLARALLVQYGKGRNIRLDPAMLEGNTPRDGGAHIAMAWADIFRKAGRLAQPGSHYSPERSSVPESAYDFLLLARTLLPPEADRLPCLRAAAALSSLIPSYPALHMGHLAELSLAEPDNWRAQLDCGLSFLKACRVEAGLHEIAAAHAIALEQGQDAAFTRVLAARSPLAYNGLPPAAGGRGTFLE